MTDEKSYWDVPDDEPEGEDERQAAKVTAAMAIAAVEAPLNPEERSQEDIDKFLARLKELIGEDVYNANPQIVKFAQHAYSLSEDAALQSGVTLMVIALRDYAVSDEFFRFCINVATRVYIWSARREMVHAIKRDRDRGLDITSDEYWDRCEKWLAEGLNPWTDQYMQCMEAVDKIPPRDSTWASNAQH